jgi:hypothetical protein
MFKLPGSVGQFFHNTSKSFTDRKRGAAIVTEALQGYIFYEFAALLVLAAGVGFAGLLLRQPLIVSFIAVGIVAGPSVWSALSCWLSF